MVASFKILGDPLGRVFRTNQVAFLRLNCTGKVRRKGETFIMRCMSDSDVRCQKENIVSSTYPPIKLPDKPFHDVIFENLVQKRDLVAIECGATGKKFTYKDLYTLSKNLAYKLQKTFHLKRGDRQTILLPNCPEFPSIILAGSRIGVTSSTINPLYTQAEISTQINIARPKILFTMNNLYAKAVGALNTLQLKIPVVTLKRLPDSETPPGAIDFLELAESSRPLEHDPVTVDLEDTLVIPFSSGTSGLPKGVELRHLNISTNFFQVELAAHEMKENPGKDGQGVCLAVLPMFHIYGMMAVCFDGLRCGLHLVSLPRFEPKLFVETFATKKIQLAYLVPPLVFFLANQPAVQEKYLKDLYFVVTGAAPCGVSDIMAFKKKCPKATFTQGYGMTEAGPVISLTHKDRHHKVGSVGHLLSLTNIKIVDSATGKNLPQDVPGEIWVKGPQVMKGYFNHPDTSDIFDAEGFLRTGDIGYYDEDLDLFIVDRLKEIIKVKGFQVAPAEIEEFLKSHPKIADAGVVGIPHENLGEVPRAFVVIKEGFSLTEKEVLGFVEDNLSSLKRLRGGVRFLKAIPRSSAGKILRRELQKLD